MDVGKDHWLEGVTRSVSPNHGPRADPDDISVLVVHCISLPPGEYGTGMPEALFRNELDLSRHPALADLEGVTVSAHVLIERSGRVLQLVAFDRAAWHAGVSCWRGRHACNGFSIGIELEGTDGEGFAAPQYAALVAVTRALLRRYPRLAPDTIVGHLEIAPGRKTDPGPHFDWAGYLAALRQPLGQRS